MRTAGLKYGDYPFKENVTVTTIFYYALPYMVVGGSYLQMRCVIILEFRSIHSTASGKIAGKFKLEIE